MIKKATILLVLIIASITLFAQEEKAQKKENTWKTLAKITFKQEYDELMGFDIDVPVFSQTVKDLEGQEVEVEGYIIPVEGYKQQSNFVFSAYPYNMCFFCGGAGPETVMEVNSDDKKLTYTSKPIVIKGVLKLNSGDINKLMYTLNDAVLVSTKK